MDLSHPVIKEMWGTLETPPEDVTNRVHSTSATEIRAELEKLGLTSEECGDAFDQWEEFRSDAGWLDLLTAVVAMIERQRGNPNSFIPHWADLNDLEANGRLFYVYVSALCAEGTRSYLAATGCPSDVIESTLDDIARHAGIHRRIYGNTGIDAGWWILLPLRGELLGVGNLQFHRVTLGVSTSSPKPWYTESEVEELGVGFRPGDESVGIHIPAGVSFTPERVHQSIERARELFASMWPVDQRRVATCRSWMLDDQLANYLPPTSNIIQFQRLFTLLPRWNDDDSEILEFVFRRPGAALESLPQTNTLERAAVDLIQRGGCWRSRPGWFDFDGQ